MKNPSEMDGTHDLPMVFHEAIMNRIGSFESVRKMSREDIVKEQVGWKLGDPMWFNYFKDWLEKAGLKIVEDA